MVHEPPPRQSRFYITLLQLLAVEEGRKDYELLEEAVQLLHRVRVTPQAVEIAACTPEVTFGPSRRELQTVAV